MLAELCHRPLIEKPRYEVEQAGRIWHVDAFAGENAGLVVAEIELDHPKEVPGCPAALGRRRGHSRRALPELKPGGSTPPGFRPPRADDALNSHRTAGRKPFRAFKQPGDLRNGQLFSVHWRDLFVPSHSIGEMIVRGTIMYLALFVLLRVILKRQSSGLGVTDLLVVVFIADAAQNGMAKEYRSVTEGIVLVATIIGWDYVLDWLGHCFPAFQRLVRPAPLTLVRHGRLLRDNMRRELVTKEELMSQLREQGVDSIQAVRTRTNGGGRTHKRDQNGRHLGPPWARSRHSDRVLEHPLSSPNPTEASRPRCVTDIHVAPDS